jgi:hypothetical protein
MASCSLHNVNLCYVIASEQNTKLIVNVLQALLDVNTPQADIFHVHPYNYDTTQPSLYQSLFDLLFSVLITQCNTMLHCALLLRLLLFACCVLQCFPQLLL